jgi:hypothetical protein
MKLYTEIDNKLQLGYLHMLENRTAEGCDIWLDAWEDIKILIKETGLKDIFELDKKYPWRGFISNYAQDLETELRNAGMRDALYHQKRVIYCRELLNFCGKNERIIRSTRRAVCESYSKLSDMDTCDQLYEEWLREDPDWGYKKPRHKLQQSASKNRSQPIRTEKTGRNDPCPCGSCKKYKKCCGA